MENYIEKYDLFQEKIVYVFRLGDGGIGDFTKYFLHILDICIENSIRLYVLKTDMILHNFLKLKYEKMYTIESDSEVYVKDISILKPDILYSVSPFMFYNKDLRLNLPLSCMFYFTDDVVQNVPVSHDNYISIHLRLGDAFLETDTQYVLCKSDTRQYNETALFAFIEANCDKNIMFFCDNNAYKERVKAKYDFITITSYPIGHTSLSNTTQQQVLDGITEFYLLANSDAIYHASDSGFSLMAAKFREIPYKKI